MLQEYFSKINIVQEFMPYQLGAGLERYVQDFPSLEGKKIAFVGVKNDSTATENDAIRKELYSLVAHTSLETILVDLGDILAGETPAETHAVLKTVIQELLELDIVVLVLCTNLEQGEALYQPLEGLGKSVEATLISSHLPILEYQLLNRICAHTPNYLKNLNVLGFQSHYIPPKALDTLENLNFGYMRLGALKANIEEAEVYLRDAYLTLFNMNAVRHADAPGQIDVQPNGLTSEEACQLARYTGVSDTSRILGIFGYQEKSDPLLLTAKLISQLIWYYLDGYANRTQDSPELHSEFTKYRCDINDTQPPILFLKSKRTSRWWMNIEHPSRPEDERSTLCLPCTYDDYQVAASGDTPERYLQAIKRLY
jgi:formiminoglutamase